MKSIENLIVEVDSIQAELSRRDSSFFTSFVMRDPATKKYFVQEPLHQRWHRCWNSYLWNLNEAPREHGKSEQVVAWLIWMLGKNPNLRIKYISNSDEQAAKRVNHIGSLIQTNDRIKLVFPKLAPDYDNRWTQHAITVKRTIQSAEPSIEGFGVLSSGTGVRADILVFDDVCDFENTIKNPAMIPKVKEAYYNKWINTLVDNGRVIYIFTRWHEKDLSHELIKNSIHDSASKTMTAQTYHYTCDLINDNLDPICSLWPRERLEARLGAIGKRAFARNFQGRAMSSDECIFSSIDACLDYNLSPEQIDERWPRFMGVDIGHRTDDEAAYTVLFTIAVAPDGRRYVVDVDRGRWISTLVADKIFNKWRQIGHQAIFVENNAYQQSLIDWIRQLSSARGMTLPIKGFTTGQNKLDTNLGLPSLAIEIENRRWVVPMAGRRHDATCKCGFCVWIDELKSWPVGEYCDTVMASWFAREAANIGSRHGIMVTGL